MDWLDAARPACAGSTCIVGDQACRSDEARVYAMVDGDHDDEVDEAVVKERTYGVSIKARWKRWPKRERRKRKEWRKG